ncbi:MAG: hypothetical protein CR988_01180 [Treponema sp.]|nr:MAG: hypothetical protein CR988_01180 [Treponema sp.]
MPEKQDNVRLEVSEKKPPKQEVKLIYRNVKDKVLFGVCSGLAEYFEVEPLVIRLLVVLLTFAGGGGIIAYLICLFMTNKKE